MRVIWMQFERVRSIGLAIGIRLGGGNFDHISTLVCEAVGSIRRANRKASGHKHAFRRSLLRHE
jgi:hypothetical protein